MPRRATTVTAPRQAQPHAQAVSRLGDPHRSSRQCPIQLALPDPRARQLPNWINIGLSIAVVAAAIPYPVEPQSHVSQSAAALVQPVVSLAAVSPPNQATLSRQGNGAADNTPLEALFSGDANSLVARSVGHAEGTRTVSGKRTGAYYGHIDPGNSAWNVGSFSYQHQSRSPADADRLQMQRLKSQAVELRQQAAVLGIPLGLQEELNGIDLANQAPLAALGENGYIPRLAQAYERQLRGADAIVWARTWAYVDPETEQLNAPGLGNRLWQVRADQARRRRAIDDAVNNITGDRHGLPLTN
ncbi:MAG: hypothetical protein WBA10_12610 [Elainellaceae cyanobacterium]